MDIKDGIDADGIVEDLEAETYYNPLKQLVVEDGFLRVIGDNDFTDIEIRIPFLALETLGFQKTGNPETKEMNFDTFFGDDEKTLEKVQAIIAKGGTTSAN
jgi:hypothetical protein